jgi:hypothetical protein
VKKGLIRSSLSRFVFMRLPKACATRMAKLPDRKPQRDMARRTFIHQRFAIVRTKAFIAFGRHEPT